MTHLKEKNPRIICYETKCYAPNNQNSIEKEIEVTAYLDKERRMIINPI
jgi:hypothetical protein